MILKRNSRSIDGIFGDLFDQGIHLGVTLEHAYLLGNVYLPKFPVGEYKCVRGLHQLDSGKSIDTFEITGVIGHAGILFHMGNYNQDSSGCVLLGYDVKESPQGKMITNSDMIFENFMKYTKGVDSFELTVQNNWQ